jgi:hypothetical protein
MSAYSELLRCERRQGKAGGVFVHSRDWMELYVILLLEHTRTLLCWMIFDIILTHTHIYICMNQTLGHCHGEIWSPRLVAFRGFVLLDEVNRSSTAAVDFCSLTAFSRRSWFADLMASPQRAWPHMTRMIPPLVCDWTLWTVFWRPFAYLDCFFLALWFLLYLARGRWWGRSRRSWRWHIFKSGHSWNRLEAVIAETSRRLVVTCCDICRPRMAMQISWGLVSVGWCHTA